MFIFALTCVLMSKLWQDEGKKHRKAIRLIFTSVNRTVVKILQSSFAGCVLSFSGASAHRSMFMPAVRADSGAPSFPFSSRTLPLNTHRHTRGCKSFGRCLFRAGCLLEAVTANIQTQQFHRSVSGVSLTVLPLQAPSCFLLSNSPLLWWCKTLCASMPTSLQVSYFTDSFLLLSCHFHSPCLPVYQSSHTGRASLRDPSIPFFPNKISLPCCQAGFSEVHITASRFKNLSLRDLL